MLYTSLIILETFLLVESNLPFVDDNQTFFGSAEDLIRLNKNLTDFDQEFLSNFDQENKTKEFPTIENLNKFIRPFQRCFVHVMNNRNLDLHQPDIPIYLSQSEAVAEFYNNGYANPNYIRYIRSVQKGLYKTDQNITNEKSGCTSKFFIDGPSFHEIQIKEWIRNYVPTFIGFCMSINQTEFVPKSKPWNCQVNLVIFPPKYTATRSRFDDDKSAIFLDFGQTDLWYRQSTYRGISFTATYQEGYKHMIPSSVPILNINILSENDHMDWLKGGTYLKWIWRYVMPEDRFTQRYRTQLHFCNEVFISMITSTSLKSVKRGFATNITRIIGLKPCFNCFEMKDRNENVIQEIELKMSLLESTNLEKLLTLLSPKRNEMVAFKTDFSLDLKMSTGLLLAQYVETCDPEKNMRFLFANPDKDDKFSLVLLQVVQTLFQNFSYVFSDTSKLSCENHVRITDYQRIPKIILYADIHQEEVLEFAVFKQSDVINTPTFVSCGRASKALMANESHLRLTVSSEIGTVLKRIRLQSVLKSINMGVNEIPGYHDGIPEKYMALKNNTKLVPGLKLVVKDVVVNGVQRLFEAGAAANLRSTVKTINIEIACTLKCLSELEKWLWAYRIYIWYHGSQGCSIPII
ncbi:unnamed protein product [Orchesella dallaii]|uniref:Uncharacterized protein n=1 Tax=Orchesella dallaii TaxID=48710 RepID=A0ABP1RJC1_9HEXA